MTGPQPPQPAPGFDPANTLLGEVPAQLATSLMQTPAGQRLVLTIRTASTTVTVLLAQPDAKAWGANLSGLAARMSAAGLIVGGPGMPANGNGGPK